MAVRTRISIVTTTHVTGRKGDNRGVKSGKGNDKRAG